MGYTSQYPPAFSDTYVKATFEASIDFMAYMATDPSLSLIGDSTDNAWMGNFEFQRFHIDLGSAKIITRIYYENYHYFGIAVDGGVQNFTFWGSNVAGAFSELTYGIDTNWTELTVAQNTFDEHIELDQADPKYIIVTNTTAYRYYAFKFADSWGGGSEGVRRIELQSGDSGYHSQFIYSDTNVFAKVNQSLYSDSEVTNTKTQRIYSDAVVLGSATQTINSDAIIRSETAQLDIDSDCEISDDIFNVYLNKFICENYAYIVTDKIGSEIIKFDLDAHTYTKYSLTDIDNAKNLSIRKSNKFIYISSKDGQVAKVDYDDLNSQSILNTAESNQLYAIATLNNNSYVYISDDDSEGQLFVIDDSVKNIINTDFRTRISKASHAINTVLNWTKRFFIANTKFNVKKETQNYINTDFRYLQEPVGGVPSGQNPYESLEPFSVDSFVVKIDGVTIDDVISDSIEINTVVDTQPIANFTLVRNFDNPNYTLEGGLSEVTEHNLVQIYFNSILWFEGYITNLSESSEQESVEVTAEGEKNATPWVEDKTPFTINNKGSVCNVLWYTGKTVNLPLVTKNEQLGLYDVIHASINVGSPLSHTEAGEDNGFYRGVAVHLGTKKVERVVRGWFTLKSWEEIDTWVPEENVDYFYVVNATLDEPFSESGQKQLVNDYIGTSLSLTDDLWQIETLTGVVVFWQRVYDVVETDLGWYTKGSEPYKVISAENGIYESAYKYEDKDDGLYETKEVSYDYSEYAKNMAIAEYNKLDLYQTDVELILTLDALLFYNLKLVDKINIVNTTQSNIFKNTKGFPLSIKAITISSKNMSAIIKLNSSKSSIEGWSLFINVHEFVPESPTSYAPKLTDEIAEYSVKLYQKVNPKNQEDVF